MNDWPLKPLLLPTDHKTQPLTNKQTTVMKLQLKQNNEKMNIVVGAIVVFSAHSHSNTFAYKHSWRKQNKTKQKKN